MSALENALLKLSGYCYPMLAVISKNVKVYSSPDLVEISTVVLKWPPGTK